jgi:heme ABC exporter ATP-binding subunit CcmA
MAAVTLRSVVALAGRFPVLAGANLTVEAGELVMLRGANGAGKSSLLRLCAGLLSASEGEVWVLGHDLRRDIKAARRSVGLLGHSSFLYDDLSVGDNVTFAVRAAGGTSEEASAAIDQLGLGGRLRSLAAGKLSAGQRRRCALAVLVARRPELWLLDEPHAGLDAPGRVLMDQLIVDALSAGATVLVASHESGGIAGAAARTVTVSGGRTEEAALVA